MTLQEFFNSRGYVKEEGPVTVYRLDLPDLSPGLYILISTADDSEGFEWNKALTIGFYDDLKQDSDLIIRTLKSPDHAVRELIILTAAFISK